MGQWFGQEQRPAAESSGEKPAAYYVAAKSLSLLDAPGGKPIGHLPLHAKVLRYRLERDYALVRVEASGQEGWVDNSRLDWHPPSRPRPASPPSQRAETPAAKPAPAPKPAAPEPAASEPPAPAAQSPYPLRPEPIPKARDDGTVSPGIFNPY
jgi:hypothetical protein